MAMTSTTSPAPLTAVSPGRLLRSAPTAALRQGRGAVLAAVDDSPLASAVVRRAAAVAAAENRELLLVTVVAASTPASSRPSANGYAPHVLSPEGRGLDLIARLAPAMTGVASEPRVVVAEYLARGGQRRQSRRVGATILRIARAHGAAVIVIGLPDQEHQRDRSVSRRVAHGAPAATRVALVSGPDAAGPYKAPATATAAAVDAANRRQLAGRAHLLQSVELPRLRRALLSGGPLPSATREQLAVRYETALAQLRILQHLLDTTAP
ncbi:MAG: hypothetical protein QOI76_1728 [Frankiales bacterium]|jgi:nucleotide-binding universal stress UspA family protein|nr:hypothetical protein [Frankiales bacterium]